MSNILTYFLKAGKARNPHLPSTVVARAHVLKAPIVAPAATGFTAYANEIGTISTYVEKLAPVAKPECFVKPAPAFKSAFADAVSSRKVLERATSTIYSGLDGVAFKAEEFPTLAPKAKMSAYTGPKFVMHRRTAALKAEAAWIVDLTSSHAPGSFLFGVDKITNARPYMPNGKVVEFTPVFATAPVVKVAPVADAKKAESCTVRQFKKVGSASNRKHRAASPVEQHAATGFASFAGRRRSFDELVSDDESTSTSESLVSVETSQKRTRVNESTDVSSSSSSNSSSGSFNSLQTEPSSCEDEPIASTSKMTIEDLNQNERAVDSVELETSTVRSTNKRCSIELDEEVPLKKRKVSPSPVLETSIAASPASARKHKRNAFSRMMRTVYCSIWPARHAVAARNDLVAGSMGSMEVVSAQVAVGIEEDVEDRMDLD